MSDFQPVLLGKPKQTAFGIPIGQHLFDWLLPCAFGALISIVIRYHSWSPVATLPYVIGIQFGIAVAVFIAMTSQRYRLSVPRDVVLILLALAVSIAISTAGSADPMMSVTRLLHYISVVLLALAVYFLHRDIGRIPLAAYCLVIPVVHIPFLVEVMVWIRDAEPPFFQESARIANFVNVRQYGEFAFLAAVSSSALLVLSRKLGVVSFVLTCCAVFGIIATGCRGALLCWIGFVILLSCASEVRFRIALHALAALLVTSAAILYLHSSGLLETPNFFVRQGLDHGLNHFSSGRLDLWLESLRGIAVRPLFGFGAEGYWLSGCCNRSWLQPHNFVLQLLLDFGVVGCSILVLLSGYALKRLGGLRKLAVLVCCASPVNSVLACLLAAYLAYSLVDGVLYHPLPMMHFALFCGLFAAGLRRARLS
jgi:O-antigen ligase